MRNLLAVLAFFCAGAAPAQANDPQAMREAVALAAEVCGEFQRSGSGSEFELSGGAQAKVSNFFRNFADIGVEGSGSISRDEYDNVLRGELASELRSTRDCRQEMAKYFIDKLSLSGGTGSTSTTQQVARRAPDLSGTWSFTGTCPNGFGTVPVNGEFRMQRVGETQYSGQAYSSLGLTGQFQSTVSGSNVRSEIQWSDFSFETANGQLSRDGKTMEITDTAGCRTRAFLLN